jgi:outer membrane protein assembly factor BamB
MYEPEATRQQRLAYEKVLYRYSTALEHGDFDTIIAILKMAERDPFLEQMIIEAHSEGYQQEEYSMHQNDTRSQVAQPQPGTAPSLPERVRKPKKRWFVALERTVTVLVVAILVAGALFLFTTHNKQQPKGSLTNTGAQKTTPAGIVVAANLHALTARDASTGALLWQNTALGTLDLNAPVGLTIADQTVYAAYNKQVWAFQVSTGKSLWHRTLGTVGPTVIIGDFLPQLAVDQNIVYTSGYSGGNLYALNATTGQILWSYNAPILTVGNGIAYVLASNDNNQNAVKALQGKNGRVLWHYNTPMPLSAVLADNVLYVQAAHSLINDPTGDHKERKPLFALNATNGNAIWSTVAPANSPSQLVVAQGMVVLFDGNHFCGYHASTGKSAWCTTGPQNDINGAGLISVGGVVYGVYNPSFNGSLVEAINPQSGQVYWSREVNILAGNSPQVLALGDSLILPVGQVVLSRINGRILWKFPDDVLAAAVNS